MMNYDTVACLYQMHTTNPTLEILNAP
jgi:hypothetical protein